MLLTIDTEQLTSPWQVDPVGDDTFPHVYGPINASAVVHAEPSTAAAAPADGSGAAPAAVRLGRFRQREPTLTHRYPTSVATSSAVPQLNVTPAPPWP